MHGLGLVLLGVLAAGDSPANTSPAVRDETGVLVHRVESPYQSGPTEIRVLLPENMTEKTIPVVYVLPVEKNRESRFGDGLKEIRTHNLHNKYGVIFVAPTFAELPWYADHPTNPRIRQETYFLKTVVPFIEKTYPVHKKSAGRLLLGFSKSGWGAWSLLLRHPETFGRAAAWDAPVMMTEVGKYGNRAIFGTQDQFEKYQLTTLLESTKIQDPSRLILLGRGNFEAEHTGMRAFLEAKKIPHEFHEGKKRKHDWHSGWVPIAVELLLNKTE